jgi:hypothetical protein
MAIHQRRVRFPSRRRLMMHEGERDPGALQTWLCWSCNNTAKMIRELLKPCDL